MKHLSVLILAEIMKSKNKLDARQSPTVAHPVIPLNEHRFLDNRLITLLN